MNFTVIFVAVAAMLLVVFVFVAIWASRFAKVPPNQVLIVSGRKVQLPDGGFVGFRIVKGGGTFVLPVVERVDVLSLEVLAIEMPKSRAQTACGRSVEVESAAQVKINGDDASVIAAAEHFPGKSQTEIKNIVMPILGKHLCIALANSSAEEAIRNPAARAAKVQANAAPDLAGMGLSMISFTIRNARGM